MRAIQIVRIGLPSTALRVTECPEPAGGPGLVRIRVRAFGVNLSDLLARMGLEPDCPRLPWIPGVEVAGLVEDDGEDGRRFPPGTAVAGLTFEGGYAEVAVARSDFVTPLPPGMGFPEGAALPAAGATAWLALREMTTVRAGDRVLIHAAAGGVGTMAVQLARDAGCRVFGTVGSPGKVAALQALGVAHPMDHTVADVEAEVMAATGGEGLDLVLDSPRHDTLGMDLRLLAPSGRLVIVGAGSASSTQARRVPGGRVRASDIALDAWGLGAEGKGILGVHLRRTAEARPGRVATALREVFAMAAAGRLKPLLDQVCPFEDTARAHERLHGRESVGKIVVSLAPPESMG
jgi:NADPH:quinone reductase-like Zn-dependent oxidoreductase